MGAFLISACDSNEWNAAVKFRSPSLSSSATRLAIALKRKCTAVEAMPNKLTGAMCKTDLEVIEAPSAQLLSGVDDDFQDARSDVFATKSLSGETSASNKMTTLIQYRQHCLREYDLLADWFDFLFESSFYFASSGYCPEPSRKGTTYSALANDHSGTVVTHL